MRDKTDCNWAYLDDQYTVTELVAKTGEETAVEAPSLPSTDDTAERMQLMEELFQLQETDIALLKAQLEKFVEVVEGIIDLTEVVSQNNIENRSKLLIISKSCKEILKPSE